MCIINHSRRFIFVHVPKCAGTTVAAHLSPLTTYRDLEIGATQLGEAAARYYRDRFGLAKHSTLEEIAKVVGREEISAFFTFGFVRNPYDRVVSFFTFLRSWTGSPLREALQNMRDVNEFIQSEHFRGDGVDRLYKPQAFWLFYREGGVERSVDFVGRVENMDESLAEIDRRLGLPPQTRLNTALPRHNASRDTAKNVNLELDEISVALINERYAEDFQRFGYAMQEV
ncbi:MAG: sulfotransferase family 2 domain-containing protein [Rhodovarius sp.]|nr:sulfotransferase family protein [Rhodovarius sp.]MDW8314742.1 sulfotransferase family 2 domain-containing protein [Rhodovarius sp.]